MKKKIMILLLLVLVQSSFLIISSNVSLLTAQATEYKSNTNYDYIFENYLQSVFSINKEIITINKINEVSNPTYGGKEIVSNLILNNNILGEIRINEALESVSSVSFSVSDNMIEDLASIMYIPHNLTERIFTLFLNDANYCNRESELFDILPIIKQNTETIINKLYFIYKNYKSNYDLLKSQLNDLSKMFIEYQLSKNDSYLDLTVVLYNSTNYVSKLKVWTNNHNKDMLAFSIERNITYADSWIRTESHYVSGYLFNGTIIPIDFCGGPEIPWKITSMQPQITYMDAISIAKEKCRYPQHIEKINYEAILYPGSEGGRDPYTLYPLWVVYIQYDSSYQLEPNSSTGTSGYVLKIWADTGDILLSAEQRDFGFINPAPLPDIIMDFVTIGFIVPPVVIFSVLYYRNIIIKKYHKK